MLNERRLKTGPYVTCFLFFLSSKSALKKSTLSDGQFRIDKCWFQDSNFGFYMVYALVSNASYEIRSCLLLNDYMFSCCFHVFLNIFLCHGWMLTEGGGGPNFQRRIDVKRGTMSLDGSPKYLLFTLVLVPKEFDLASSGGYLTDNIKQLRKFLIIFSAIIKTKLWSLNCLIVKSTEIILKRLFRRILQNGCSEKTCEKGANLVGCL